MSIKHKIWKDAANYGGKLNTILSSEKEPEKNYRNVIERFWNNYKLSMLNVMQTFNHKTEFLWILFLITIKLFRLWEISIIVNFRPFFRILQMIDFAYFSRFQISLTIFSQKLGFVVLNFRVEITQFLIVKHWNISSSFLLLRFGLDFGFNFVTKCYLFVWRSFWCVCLLIMSFVDFSIFIFILIFICLLFLLRLRWGSIME